MDPIASFSGLASGLQWQDMIDQIMKLEAARAVDPLKNRVGTQNARIDAWKAYEGLVGKLKSASLSLRDGSSFGLYNATAGTTAAGRGLISATASASATPGSYSVEVIQLARAEKVNGRNEASTTTALNLSGQFFVNGRAVDVAATDSLNQVRDKINAVNSGSNASGVTATILTTGTDAHRLILTADQTGSRGIELVDSASGGGVLQELGILDGNLTANRSPVDSSRTESQRFSSSTAKLANLLGVSPAPAQTSIRINGQKIDVDLANDTMIDVMNRVSPPESVNLVEETVGGRTAYRLSVAGSVEADSEAADPAVSQRVVELLGFQRSGRSGEITSGSDAIASIDGFRVTRRTNVVADAIAGVSINLLAAETTGRSASTSNSDLAVTIDPKSISTGTYAVNFEATTAPNASTLGAGLALVSQAGVQNGTIANGDYAVSLTTTVDRTTSADPNLSVSAAPLSVAAGTYAVEATVTRAQSTTNGDLVATAAGSGVAPGSYAAELTVERTVTDNNPAFATTQAGTGVPVGNYAVDITAAATKATASAASAFSSASLNPSQNVTFTLDRPGGGSVSVGLINNETLTAFVTRLNGQLGSLGLEAVDNGGNLEVRSTTFGSAGSFTVTGSHADVTAGLGIGTTGGQSYAGADVQGQINGVAATGTGQILTGAGVASGLAVEHTGTTPTAGVVSITDAVTGTINGTAATWDQGAKTLTSADGLVLQYGGTLTAGSATGPISTPLGTVTIADSVSGTIGGVAASWDAGTQTFTRADGLAVAYSGAFATGTLGGSTATDLGDVTLTDTQQITGGTIGGQAATWDDVAGTLTTNVGTALEGLSVAYSGPAASGVVGTVQVQSTTTLDGVTIGGEAADWDPDTGMIRGRVGSRFEALEMSYAGPISYAETGQPLHVGDLVISGDVAVDLTISRDTEGTTEAIRAYVDAYNGVRDFVAKQQASGDVLATNGTLRTSTRSLTEVMLADIASLSASEFSRAAHAGVELDRHGSLTIDSARLTAALERSPNDVKALFGEVGSAMYTASDSLAAEFGGTVSSQIRFLEESNAALENRVLDAEARLEVRRQGMIRQYTQMETMISQIQSQGNWLTQQISALQPSG